MSYLKNALTWLMRHSCMCPPCLMGTHCGNKKMGCNQ